jgi:hypothetical protein
MYKFDNNTNDTNDTNYIKINNTVGKIDINNSNTDLIYTLSLCVYMY